MIAMDFEYDGEYLKNYGFTICSINESGFNTITTDSQSTFNNVKLMNGKLFEITTSQYEDRLEINFQICKYNPNHILHPISHYEARELKRWLNRPSYKRFKFIQPYWADIYMEGSFNVRNVICGGEIFLLELTFISNRPFALHEPITHRIFTSATNESYTFFDTSDEIGYIYPDIKITCLQNGKLEITNSNENRITEIKNCSSGEIIQFTPKLLMSTSLPSHKIQNDFNYKFFRISNSYNNRKNTLTFSLPVEVEITYCPYVKVVM